MMSQLANITTYQAGIIQASANRQLQKFSDNVLGQFGITKMQWLVIGTVLDAGPKGERISDLAKKLGTTLPYLTNTVNLLESKHMLVRKSNNSDARAKLVVVEKKFRPKCAVIEKSLRDALRKSVYTDVTQKDFETYIKVLYKLADTDKAG